MAIDIETYYRQYGPMVLRRCRQMLKDEEAAVDAMQDTFVKLLRYRTQLEHRGPSSLLYTMATNVCLNRIRSMGRKREDAAGERLEYIARIPESTSARVAAASLLDRLFSRERASTKTMAVLHYVDGMTLAEVADAVGLSVSGVRKRLRPLRERLHMLQEEGDNGQN